MGVVAGAALADGNGVGAEAAERLMPADREQLRSALRIEPGDRRRVARRGWRRLGDARHHDVLTGEQDQLVEAEVRVVRGDRVDPRLAVTGRVLDAARA